MNSNTQIILGVALIGLGAFISTMEARGDARLRRNMASLIFLVCGISLMFGAFANAAS